MEFVLVDTHSRRLKKKIITPNEDDRDLFTGIATGNILQVKSLLHKGVNPNCSLEGWTPITFACELDKEEILDLLIDILQKKVKNHWI